VESQDIISSGLLELYVMGISSPEESRDVEEWARLYPDVAGEIASIQAGMESYAQTHAIAPTASVKEKLFAGLNSVTAPVVSMQERGTGTRKVYSISPFWKYAAAASIVLLIGSVIFNYTYYTKYQTASNDLQATQTALQQQKELANAMHNDMGVMADKNAMPVSLKGMPDVPDAAARIYWMQNTHEVYIDPSNLPQAPDGTQYQFWAIVDGKPVNGGIINRLKDGRIVHVQKMTSFGKAEAFAVSLEPAGPERPVPSHVYVMGKM